MSGILSNLGHLLGYDEAEEVHVVGAIGCDDANRLGLANHKIALFISPGILPFPSFLL
jgi:hypothetical protein